MILTINSTDKIETVIEHLDFEIFKHNLDPTVAKIFLYVMWTSRLDGECIIQPIWTFEVPDFRKYLNFYKMYDLLHSNGGQRRFLAGEDLHQSGNITIHVDNNDIVDTILEIGEKTPEFQNYYTKVKA